MYLRLGYVSQPLCDVEILTAFNDVASIVISAVLVCKTRDWIARNKYRRQETFRVQITERLSSMLPPPQPLVIIFRYIN